MFELEIEREKKHCIEAIVTPGERFTSLQHICSVENLHQFYRTYFVAQADWWIYELSLERAGDTRFDFSLSELSPLLKETDSLLRQSVRFSYDELIAAIDVAVKLRLNFLCRPRTTLTWFVFRGEPTKTVHEIWLRLNYFSEYQYLTNGFRDWAQTTFAIHPSQEVLSVVEFDKLIADIDNTTILELTPHQFTDLLEPLYEFFAQSGKPESETAVPIESLIIFLDDKGVDLIAKELERIYYEEHTDRLTRQEFLTVVTKILSELEGTDLISVVESTVLENDGNSEAETVIVEQYKNDLTSIIEEQAPSPESSVDNKGVELLEGFGEANSGFLSLIHSYSAVQDYISVDNPDSAALYKAEFVGADELDVRGLNADSTEESVSSPTINSVSESDTGTTEITRFDVHERIEIHIEDDVIEEPSFMAIEDSLQESVEKIEESEHVQEERTEFDVSVEEKLHDISDPNQENGQVTHETEKELIVPDETVDIEIDLSSEKELVNDEIGSEQLSVSENNPIVTSESVEVASTQIEETATTDTMVNTEVYSSYETQTSRGYIPSLSSKIDSDKRDSLIKKMFHKDAELYDTFVREIDKTYSWKEAAAAIDRFYVRHNIKDTGALAKELRTIIQKRYAR